MLNTDRRSFVRNTAVLAGALLLPTSRAFAQPVRFTSTPFTLGVASGDPDETSVVLWTRLAPDPMAPDFGLAQVPVPVRWELADDEGFTRILRSGEVVALPDDAHAVHVVAEGLRPDSRYFYRFHAGDATSATGRTRTIPAAGQAVSSLRYAYAACQRFENGYYGAWRHAAADNPDVILFLGDYIYENGPRDNLPRRHNKELATDLASYRKRYGLYKADADLQAAHAAAPWMVVWDDHEVVNNYKAERSPGMEDRAAFLKRRTEAYKAWYEHMPVRPHLKPTGPSLKIYRTLDWGSLAKFQMVDARQYGSWTDWPARKGEKEVILDSVVRTDPQRSLLGFEQERWLEAGLTGSGATWNVMAQQFAMLPLKRPDEITGELGYGNDSWGGFPATFDRVVGMLGRTRNPVVVGGDMHSFAAINLRQKPEGAVVAPAFVAGAVSSPSPGGLPKMQELIANNPDFYWADNRVNGYSLAEVTAKEMIVTLRGLDDVTRADTAAHVLSRFAIENGKAGATKLA
jgi:alkaline phosphatase D